MGERIRRRSSELIRKGAPPGTAMRQALREVEGDHLVTNRSLEPESVSEPPRPSNIGLTVSYWSFVAVYSLAPIAAIAAFCWFIFTGQFLGFVGFWIFGFLGMFALGSAKRIEPKVRV